MMRWRPPRVWLQLAAGVVAVLGALFAVACVGRLFVLGIDSLDGAGTPSVAAMSFPAGSEVVSAEKKCASGGCWMTYTVLPPLQSTDEFVERFPHGSSELAGTFWDPRRIGISVERVDATYEITARYWAL